MERKIILLMIILGIFITSFILGYLIGSPTIMNDCNNPLNEVIKP